MGDTAAAGAGYHQHFVGGGLLGVALGGGMPVLQHPDPVGDVNQGAGDFLGSYTAEGAVDREF